MVPRYGTFHGRLYRMGCMSPNSEHIENHDADADRNRGIGDIERPEMMSSPVHVDEIDHRPYRNSVDQVAGSAPDDQRQTRLCEELMMGELGRIETHAHHRAGRDDRDERGLERKVRRAEQSERGSGIRHVREVDETRHDGHARVDRKSGPDQRLRDLIDDHDDDRQPDFEPPGRRRSDGDLGRIRHWQSAREHPDSGRRFPPTPESATAVRMLSRRLPMPDPAQVAVRSPAPRRLEIWLPIVIVVVDQITKALVRARLPVYTSVTVVPGFVDFTHVPNTGAAFGLLSASDFPFKTALIAIIATGAMVSVGLYAAKLAHHQLFARTGLALIIGAAAGNLIDRITVGSVVDFVDVYWRTHHFWAFNVADSAISIGVSIMILDMLGVGGHASHSV